jgi:uncharacterized protein (DUF58 family)
VPRRGVHPKTLLFILIGVVPLAVAVTGVVSFLLQRAGYGAAVWALLPFLGLILVAAVIGAVLGRAASTWRGDGSPDRDSDRRRDDV